MAANVTLSELRARVRRMANLDTTPASSSFASDTIVDEALNRHCKQLYDKLRAARPKGFYQVAESISVAAGDAYYPLPEDFLELTTIFARDASGGAWPLEPFLPHELPDLLAFESGGGGSASMYAYNLAHVAGDYRLEIRPTPGNSSDVIHYRYVPAFVPLLDASDYFDGVNGWEDWACYRAAMDLMNREESDISGLMALWQELDKLIDSLAGERDAGRGYHVVDVERDAYWKRRRSP